MRLAPGAEFDLIRRFVPHPAAPGERGDVRVGPGDDCAVVAGDGIALSCDMSVEGVHFRRDWLSAREIGWRAAAAALSDLAAMAARPIGVLCSLAISDEDAPRFAEHLMAGVRDAAESVGGVLLGGDLTRSLGPIAVDVTVVGECPSPVLRSGARPGDEVWVTGELGGSAAYVAALLRDALPDASARRCFAAPVPRVREAAWLRSRGIPSAMIDISDGLAGDAAQIAAASGVAVVLETDAVPVHEAARTAADGAALALSGGEDYELCFCAAGGAVQPHASAFESETGVRLTRVGRVKAGAGVWRADGAGGRVPLGRGGYQHFGEGRE
ncbi:MAG TPA: thiamine-phosphate kinase [Longimicrobiaceae bacterium]|jgi:thiamine-monophosphate kinase|nr:thiamine-phosphate kinase [Longimicrobiaceae bacterium]